MKHEPALYQYNTASHWDTWNELDFLKKIGTWRKAQGDRKALLKQYRDSMRLRKRWGWVDALRVRDYIERELKGL